MEVKIFFILLINANNDAGFRKAKKLKNYHFLGDF